MILFKKQKKLEDLIKEYGLEKILTVHYLQLGPELTVTLYLFKNAGKFVSIPYLYKFKKQVLKVVNQQKQKWESRNGQKTFKFQIGKPVALEDIKKEQDAWNLHCELFWQACD